MSEPHSPAAEHDAARDQRAVPCASSDPLLTYETFCCFLVLKAELTLLDRAGADIWEETLAVVLVTSFFPAGSLGGYSFNLTSCSLRGTCTPACTAAVQAGEGHEPASAGAMSPGTSRQDW